MAQRNPSSVRAAWLAATVVLTASGCTNAAQLASSSATGSPMAASSPLTPPNPPAKTALANGLAIFRSGKDLAGRAIVARPPALYPSCAACHGANGAGGMHLPGGAVSADLRHHALVVAQKHPYTLALLERAISSGVDNEGGALNKVMPRWQMSQQDLHDVAQYVFKGLH